jgi:hypothetical protein
MHVLENDEKETAAAIEVYEAEKGTAQVSFEEIFLEQFCFWISVET